MQIGETPRNAQQHTATLCNTLQRTDTAKRHLKTHCNALQRTHTAETHLKTHCYALQRSATHSNAHTQQRDTSKRHASCEGRYMKSMWEAHGPELTQENWFLGCGCGRERGGGTSSVVFWEGSISSFFSSAFFSLF